MVRRHSARLNWLFSLLLMTFPVFVPQTMFYDVGIAIFWLFVTAELKRGRALERAIITVVLVNACFLFRSSSFSLIWLGALIVAMAGCVTYVGRRAEMADV
jgi:hypothetical protein